MPETEWDVRVSKLYDPNDFNVLSRFFNAISNYHTHQTWEEMKPLLSEDDKNILLGWAEHNIHRLPIKPPQNIIPLELLD